MTGISRRTIVIAEAGVNHNGSRDLALELVQAASDAGADYVKFQMFRAENIVTRSLSRAEYQKKSTKSTDSQYSMLKDLELTDQDFSVISQNCRMRGIKFMSTASDEYSARFLAKEIGVSFLKIGSGELNNTPFLLKVSQLRLPVILSTGMGNLGDIQTALSVLAFGYLHPEKEPAGEGDFVAMLADEEAQSALEKNVVLLQCTSEYPAPPTTANLRAIETLRSAFGLKVGFSDHTRGVHVAVAAVAMGAEIVEKHLTISRGLSGPDHSASLEPDEFRTLVRNIRETEAALGTGRKIPSSTELANRELVSRRLVAARPIAAGSPFTWADFAFKRAERGLAPSNVWSLLGKPALRDYASDDPIDR